MVQAINKPKVTVLMPVYNGEKYLHEAIESILNQTFTDFEFLIINDGSTDNSISIIESYNDSRIRLINNEKNLGLIDTLNNGIDLAKGEYIARMDCDDISLLKRLEKQIDFLKKNPSACLVATHIALIDENGNSVGYWSEDMKTVSISQIKSMIPEENCIAHPTVMIKKEVVKAIKYNKAFKHNEDWGLWLTLLSQGYALAKVDEPLLKYRIHSEGTTVKANREGVRKKIIQFKYRYIKERTKTFKLSGIDCVVLVSLVRNLFKYRSPIFYSNIARIYSTNLLKLVYQFVQFRKQFYTREQLSHLFFFPFYDIGGAENVHASIVETVANKKPIVLFTSHSKGTGLLPEFKKNATVLKIEQLLNWPFAKEYIIKTITAKCLQNKGIHLFGCNSRFFYEMVSRIPSDAKIIDLIHAFMHEYEEGSEKWSLPVVAKINTRIVITQSVIRSMKILYKTNNISEDLLSRIFCIPNYTDEKSAIKKNMHDKLKVIFVGRNTPEKRVDLIASAAKNLAKKKSPVEFHFVGDVRNVIPTEYLPFCILHGEVSSKQELDELYSDAHILILASSREGFPMVIMEAMMHGVVPLSTNVGGISDHVRNNENGILINETENDAIVNEIVKALESFADNRDKLVIMSENAYQYAISNFGKKQFIEAYQNFLNN